MQRYNMFYQVHKGLKALLYDTALHLQHTDFWNVEEAEASIEKIEEVVRLFDKHAHSEDTFVFPAVERFEPSVADAFEQEHVKDHMLGQLLSESIALYRNSDIITDKASVAGLIQSSFAKFMIFNLEHMAKEEDILNEILWRYYSDDELKLVTRQIITAIPQEYMAQYTRWMLRGLNNAEITEWLKEVETTAPEPVFQSLFAAAERELTSKRFRQVLEAMSEGAMLA